MKKIDELLYEIGNIINHGIDKEGVIKILEILNCSIQVEILDEIKLYGDYLPKISENGMSEENQITLSLVMMYSLIEELL
ncbi:Uncharacterised protein [Clostridioides difficile]|nr:Uncharacterised protein [Clostridioides difficile]